MNCKYCGKEFPKNGRQLYCCPGCKIKANNEKRVEKSGKVSLCRYCGEEFTSLHGAKYCSVLCHAKADAERNRAKYIPVEQRKQEKVYPPKPCAECGKPFIPRSGSARYCSPECFAAARSRRTKKYKEDSRPQKRNKKRKQTTKEWNALSSEERWERMNLTELSGEIARVFPGKSFGQARLLKEQGKLPDEFGLGAN